MEKKLVYICSPLRGDYEKNMEKARIHCHTVVQQFKDVIPFAPHIYFTQFLNDNIPNERSLGMDMGLAMLDMCDELWVYDAEGISEGMAAEIEYAKEHGIPVRYAADIYAGVNAEGCVCCGEVIPEGRQVCPTCDKTQEDET